MNTYLKEERGCSRGKVHGLRDVVLLVEAFHVVVDHDSLGRALLTNQKHGQVLLGDGLDQELGPDVVHVGHQDGSVLGFVVRGVGVGLDANIPVLPFPCGQRTGKSHDTRGV